MHIFEKVPATMEEALHIALKFEALDKSKDAETSQGGLDQASRMNKEGQVCQGRGSIWTCAERHIGMSSGHCNVADKYERHSGSACSISARCSATSPRSSYLQCQSWCRALCHTTSQRRVDRTRHYRRRGHMDLNQESSHQG